MGKSVKKHSFWVLLCHRSEVQSYIKNIINEQIKKNLKFEYFFLMLWGGVNFCVQMTYKKISVFSDAALLSLKNFFYQTKDKEYELASSYLNIS